MEFSEGRVFVKDDGSGCQFPRILEPPKMKNMNSSKASHRSVPLRHSTWENKEHKSDSEILIKSTVAEWYGAKHSPASREEIKFINNLPIKYCPYYWVN